MKRSALKSVSHSAFSLLMRETITYSLTKISNISQLEEQLHELGARIGHRVLDLYTHRSNVANQVSTTKRETKVVPMLQFVCNFVWKQLFGKQADLLKGASDSEYQLHDRCNMFHKFVSPQSSVNCGAFAAGIIEGILDLAGFPCKVTAHHDQGSSGGVGALPGDQGLILLVKFEEHVILRE